MSSVSFIGESQITFRGQVGQDTRLVASRTNTILQTRLLKRFENIFSVFLDSFIIQSEPIQNLALKK